MAISQHIKNARQGSLTATDGSAVVFTLSMTEGNFSLSGLMEGPSSKPTEVEAIQDRGVHHDLVYTNQVYPSGSFSGFWTDLRDGIEKTPMDLVTALGAFASSNSTLGTGKPWTVDLEWTVNGTSLGDGANHTLTLGDCRLTFDGTEGMPANQFTINYTCYGAISAT